MSERYLVQRASGYVGNSVLWWRADRAGYTIDFDQAGRYSRREAEALTRDSNMADVMWPESVIEALATRHVDAQRMPIAGEEASGWRCRHCGHDTWKEVLDPFHDPRRPHSRTFAACARCFIRLDPQP